MEKAFFHTTHEGFPPGSPISSALANLSLNGLENILSKRGLIVCRYADDFVALGKDKRELSDVARSVINSFLAERGLSLSPEKTGICSIEDGYDFFRV